MKRRTPFIVIVIIAIAIWFAYSSHINRLRAGPRGDPVRTVNAFMNSALTLSTLLWNEDARAALRSDLEEWRKQDEDAELPQSLKDLGLEDTSYLFADKRHGKATLAAFSIFQFDSFAIDRTNMGEISALVDVSFIPQDVLGIRKAVGRLGAPTGPQRQEPIGATFHLKKRGQLWSIHEIRGELAQAISGFQRLRR